MRLFLANVVMWLSHSTHYTCTQYAVHIWAETTDNCRRERRMECTAGQVERGMDALFAEYNQQDATFHNFFTSVRRSTCFRRFFRPSSGAQSCTHNSRYLSDQYPTLYVQFWAPDDGRNNRLKHVECLTEIKKLWNAASRWFTLRIY